MNARNKEFFRDRAALSWNLAFPILLLFGFSFMFSNENSSLYKVGELTTNTHQETTDNAFTQLKHLSFVNYQEQKQAILKVDQHKIDLLVDFEKQRYWVNQTSANGYIVEQLLLASFPDMHKELTDGRPIRYIDWVMPGILGMNIMFSCLFGVGYVIVRYRKNGVLKRFQATPLTAFEFLSAQIISRLLIVLFLTVSLFIGSNIILDFYILGSIFNLLIVAILGATSLIAMSLLISARTSSEEFAGGMLNLFTWPMMFLSGVWFSLEGSPEIVQQLALIFPLTHTLEAAREIMTDGAGLVDIGDHLITLTMMTVVFLGLSSWMFDWGTERA